MLTEDLIKQLGLLKALNNVMECPAFKKQTELWRKSPADLQFLTKQSSSKKYEFTKVGKMFGLQVTRYISIKDNYLLYYETLNTDRILGYCNLENTYTHYFKVKQNKFMLSLTNGTQSSQYLFNDHDFLKHLKHKIERLMVQINFNQKYVLQELIGQGSFSKVYLVKNLQTSKKFAAKIVEKLDKHKTCTKKSAEEEKKVLTKLSGCERIYNFEQFFQQADNYVFIIQYLQGKDLMTLIRDKNQFSFDKIKHIMKQILQSLSYCHSKKIMHRDLKPQNIILNCTNFELKLIDFGLSLHVMPGTQASEYKRCGTMGYMAPEIVQNSTQNRKPYNFKCDVFSFGIIAHILLLGNNPLKGRNYEQTYQLNKQCSIFLNEKVITEKYGQDCLKILKLSLAKNPRDRPTAQQLLQMNFFTKISNLATNQAKPVVIHQKKNHHLDEISTQEVKIERHKI